MSSRILDHYTTSLDKNSIEYWQTLTFYIIALAGLSISVICIIPGLVLFYVQARYAVLGTYLSLLVLEAIVILVRKPSIKAKTVTISTLFFIFGLASLVLAGPVGQRGIGFTASVLLCSLYVGFGSALLFACLELATGIGFGLLNAVGHLTWPNLHNLSLGTWVVQSIDIFAVDIMLAIAISVLIRGAGGSFQTLATTEKKLSASLREKETLIRELYHRTKNNMQVVSSLLKLHSRELDSAQDKVVFKDVTNKIIAMSLVHQKLYESRDLSRVGMMDYIPELIALLVNSHALPRDQVGVNLKVEDIKIPIDTAVPLGLVISEIVSNSLKYAFPGSRQGKIGLELKAAGEFLKLTIEDDGIGFPEGFQVAENGRMGMRTLFTIVEHQLQGNIQVDSEAGVRYVIHFKSKLYDERVGPDE